MSAPSLVSRLNKKTIRYDANERATDFGITDLFGTVLPNHRTVVATESLNARRSEGRRNRAYTGF